MANSKRFYSLVLLLATFSFLPSSYCFNIFTTQTLATRVSSYSSLSHSSTKLWSSEGDQQDNEDLLLVKSHLQENYPSFSIILQKNDGVWKALGGAEGGGFTIFAPNANAFNAIGDTKKGQLVDPRNSETTEKIGAYHVIAEVVTADQLYNSGGVITLGGQIPVDRSVSGGFFGVGGKEDGGVTVNGAKVVQSYELGSGIVHEVDGFVSPNILWRYMDQLRIPGSS